MCVMYGRETCLGLVTCTVGSKTTISFMAFLSRISYRFKTQNFGISALLSIFFWGGGYFSCFGVWEL